MLCIYSTDHNPYFNLATEEYFLKNREDDIFMIWRCWPAVIIGKHQNALAEINYRFAVENKIRIARRLTGGGTVYHDMENVNFSFIRKGEPGRFVNFSSFISPVIDFLKELDIEAYQGLKNEIMVNGIKISGNAEHVFKNRVLHHGTLLFNTNLSNLQESLKPAAGKFTHRSVQSNRSSVANLHEHTRNPMNVLQFMHAFFGYVFVNSGGHLYTLTGNEKKAIGQLAIDKYGKWDWIFGWSPDYIFNQTWHSDQHSMDIHLAVHRGYIEGCNLRSTLLTETESEVLALRLTGSPHKENNIRTQLKEFHFHAALTEREFENLVYSFFG
jgi:lipoate---protein ligase